MEITCNRCHQAVQAGDCYCPVCGLPQLVYSAENAAAQGQPDRWNEAVRDAGSIDWKPALRFVLMLALPAGILCSYLEHIDAGVTSLPLMAITGAWAVTLYLRSQRPAWITIGAGARIGLVTGLLGGWFAAACTGASLYAMRYWFHLGGDFDSHWLNLVGVESVQQWQAFGVDAASIAMMKAWMLSPEGRAGWYLAGFGFLAAALVGFAIAGGALGARFLGRSRRPEI
jgi:hypothetical protein